ncbi:MAG TPA: ornithine carbamoyltransferase, partial [Deltaproteobacteria bacterium]|nr:ornithine carbamoyltransferase [Deltaproteobacteria bacterium]
MKKDLLKISDLTRHEIDEIFERSRILKGNHKRGMPYKPLIGKTLGLIFEKASTRTRCAFEVA